MKQERYLHDYVYMQLPGGAPEKVPADSDEISRRMYAGYSQCDPPEGEQGKGE